MHIFNLVYSIKLFSPYDFPIYSLKFARSLCLNRYASNAPRAHYITYVIPNYTVTKLQKFMGLTFHAGIDMWPGIKCILYLCLPILVEREKKRKRKIVWIFFQCVLGDTRSDKICFFFLFIRTRFFFSSVRRPCQLTLEWCNLTMLSLRLSWSYESF